MQDIAYFDLKTHEQETLFFFMFNALPVLAPRACYGL